MQRSFAAEAETSREARAHLISAEGEMKASRSLKEAADVISESPVAVHLRFLQTLNLISTEQNSIVIFPLPLEIFEKFKVQSKAVVDYSLDLD
jgi:erythrocyte band 7 integral membrane protein